MSSPATWSGRSSDCSLQLSFRGERAFAQATLVPSGISTNIRASLPFPPVSSTALAALGGGEARRATSVERARKPCQCGWLKRGTRGATVIARARNPFLPSFLFDSSPPSGWMTKNRGMHGHVVTVVSASGVRVRDVSAWKTTHLEPSWPFWPRSLSLTEEKEIPLCFQDSIWGIGFRTKEDLGCVNFFLIAVLLAAATNLPAGWLLLLNLGGKPRGKRRTEVDYLRTRVCT